MKRGAEVEIAKMEFRAESPGAVTVLAIVALGSVVRTELPFSRAPTKLQSCSIEIALPSAAALKQTASVLNLTSAER